MAAVNETKWELSIKNLKDEAKAKNVPYVYDEEATKALYLKKGGLWRDEAEVEAEVKVKEPKKK